MGWFEIMSNTPNSLLEVTIQALVASISELQPGDVSGVVVVV